MTACDIFDELIETPLINTCPATLISPEMRSEVGIDNATATSSKSVRKDTSDHLLPVCLHVVDLSTCVCTWVCVYICYSLAAGGLTAFGVKRDMVISAVCLGEGGYPLKQSGS